MTSRLPHLAAGLLAAFVARAACAAPADFVVDDARVSPPGRPMVDPEFNDVQNRVAYWDHVGGQLNISVGEIDPRTGLLRSTTGRDPRNRQVRRIDDGGVTGKKDYRYEPDTSSGPREILVYCTADKVEPGNPTIHVLHRCRTGITRDSAR